MIRFAIVGSGYRSLFYVRIAKALPDKFELIGMLCRTQEKADLMASKHDIITTCDINEIIDKKPDFIVSAVNKAGMCDNCIKWLELGFPVISETPAALETDKLVELWELHKKGAKLQVAEQYFCYPDLQKLVDIINSGIIGETVSVNISAMHDYHAMSMIRAILGIGICNMKIIGKTFELPVTETKTRYETLTTGKVVLKPQTQLTMEFDNGKVAFYDFNSEEYRSPIRKPYILVRGTRGEIVFRYGSARIYYLDENNLGQEKNVEFDQKDVITGLGQDETAISKIMLGMKEYIDGGKAAYPVEYALEDAYVSLLMQRAGKEAYIQLETTDELPWR